MNTRQQIGLSPKQRAVLLVIANLLEAHRWPPSFMEIRDAADVSYSCVRFCVEQLKAGGFIDTVPKRYRTIELTDAGKKLVKALRRKAA